MPETEKPNLDLINMVQKARMMHDAEAVPSEISGVYWIEVKCADCTPPSSQPGQWVLNVDKGNVDVLWEKIKQATEAGQLGYKSKVTTSSRSGEHVDSRTIVVMTPNRDETEIQRIRQSLNALQIDGEWIFE